mgnify:CR=1 FL=1
MLKIYEHNENYTAQIISLPTPQVVSGLDNLVKVVIQGNACLIGKDSLPGEYLFFGPETQLSAAFLKANNLYRHSELNADITKKGFFEDNGRVRTLKFKGIISSGFVLPLASVLTFTDNPSQLFIGCSFNEVDGVEICRKFVVKQRYQAGSAKTKAAKIIDKVVDSRMAPEHPDTCQFLRQLHLVKPDDKITISYKLHGCSNRVFNTLTYRKLHWTERILKWLGFKIQEQEYNYVAASRRVIKSVGFDELPGKNHFYSEDCWTKVAKEYFAGKLNQSEAIFGEVIGCDYTGKAIQPGYKYSFEKPMVYIYRISNINPQGVEVDLSYEQMKERAAELGVPIVPEFFVGDWWDFIRKYSDKKIKPGEKVRDYFPQDRDIQKEIENIFYNQLLDKPSILDSSVVEEGFVIRSDHYPKPELYKVKSPLFLLHETKVADKGESNVEDEQVTQEESL